MRTILMIIFAVVAGGFLLIQLVPYGRNHANPAVIGEPAWTSAESQALARQACYDCHSNETQWPWYSHVAPVSWLVQRDVDEGRKHLNFSEWGTGRREGEEAEEMAEVISDGEMPPSSYLITHPEARLTDAEKRLLVQGLTAIGGKNLTEEGRATGMAEPGEHGENEAEDHEGDD